MKNRKLILILSLVLALTMSLGGTLAYLTDTDSDVNTMVLGNVKIEQHEYQRAKDTEGNYKTTTETDNGKISYVLEDFEQDKMILPSAVVRNGEGWDWESTEVRMTQVKSYGNVQVFVENSNAVDKIVTVENKGNTDAYVRTYVAIEVGSTDGSLIGKGDRGAEADGTNKHGNPWTRKDIGIVEIKGNNYKVIEYLYCGAEDVQRHVGGILPAGDTTYPSLCQVFLMHTADNADLVAIDGNLNEKLDILVLSQAVQAKGFNTAEQALTAGFGAATADSTEVEGKTNVQVWLEAASTQLPKVHNVSDAAGLVAAAKEGGVIDLTGKTITFDGNRGEYITAPAEGSVKIIGGTIAGYKGDGELRMAANIKQGNVIFENVTFKIDEETSGWAMNVNISGTANVTFRNCTFTGVGCPIYQSGANTVVTIEDCTFEGEAIQAEIYNGDYQLGQDLIVKDCDFGTIANVLHIYDHDKNPSSEEIAQYLKDNGNTFTGTCKQTCN